MTKSPHYQQNRPEKKTWTWAVLDDSTGRDRFQLGPCGGQHGLKKDILGWFGPSIRSVFLYAAVVPYRRPSSVWKVRTSWELEESVGNAGKRKYEYLPFKLGHQFGCCSTRANKAKHLSWPSGDSSTVQTRRKASCEEIYYYSGGVNAEPRKKISNGKSGLPENLPLPVMSEKRISVWFRIYRF